ncbi:MAG: NAD(P)-binding protein [Fibrobacteres bacterium]|jgi:protoporphyrinogen oxidase|nr:NAD(P)-binding protein [Fibrobacterota bacterium]
MDLGIIGAGVSGLSVAKMLAGRFDLEILEKAPQIGGIARVKMVNGVPYHLVGGHCFNSKNSRVVEFVDQILPKSEMHCIKRNARIAFKGHKVGYPLEFSIREIASFDAELAQRITEDFFRASPTETSNLADWFRCRFGNALAEEYLIPYNRKIWGMEPSEMDPSWVEGKLPIPNKRQFFQALFKSGDDAMVHSTFYYPNSNTQNRLLEALADGTSIHTAEGVERLERIGGEWVVNGQRRYQRIISTMPLDLLPKVVAGVPQEILDLAGLLRWNRISNALWETEETDETWTYHPDPGTIFHRHIHIGRFMAPERNYSITESLGARTAELMESEGKKFPLLKTMIDHNVSERAYVVYDQNYKKAVSGIKAWMQSVDLIPLGRFGEWEYYNMDACMESAFRVADGLNAH